MKKMTHKYLEENDPDDHDIKRDCQLLNGGLSKKQKKQSWPDIDSGVEMMVP